MAEGSKPVSRASTIRRWAWHLGLAAVAVAVVASLPPDTYTLQQYTDHLRHEYAAWAFPQIGFRIYSEPVGSWDVSAMHPHILWETVPYAYPWGAIVLFLPAAAASNLGMAPDNAVHAASVVILSLGGVWAGGELWNALRPSYERSLAMVVVILGGIVLVFWGLNGFFDTLAAGIALVGVRAYREQRSGTALLALGAAFALHYRGWYLLPILAVSAMRVLGGSGPAAVRLWLVAGSMVVALAGFAYNLSSYGTLSEAPGFQPNPLGLWNASALELVAILAVAGAMVAAVARWERSLASILTFTLAVLLVLGLDQWQAWYPVMFLPLLPLLERRASQGLASATWIGVAAVLDGFPPVA